MKISKKNLREIMTTAWQFAKQTGESFSKCLKQAWANFKLKVKLFKGIVHFRFKKVDGSIREAWGTLKDVEDKIQGTGRTPNETIQVYFDTEKQSFRSFKKINLIP